MNSIFVWVHLSDAELFPPICSQDWDWKNCIVRDCSFSGRCWPSFFSFFFFLFFFCIWFRLVNLFNAEVSPDEEILAETEIPGGRWGGGGGGGGDYT